MDFTLILLIEVMLVGALFVAGFVGLESFQARHEISATVRRWSRVLLGVACCVVFLITVFVSLGAFCQRSPINCTL